MSYSRRDFMKLAGTGMVAAQVPAVFAGDQSRTPLIHDNGAPFELGIASYTFRKFTLGETIKMTRRLGIHKLCLKSMHLPLELSPEEIRAEAARVRDAGIDLYGAGVINMKNTGEVDRAFEYAGHAGLKVIVGVPEHDLLSYCEKKVKNSGIKLAIHNHGPEDQKYPGPESVYQRVKDMDPGMGLCVDIGHTTRLGLDPARETARFMERVYDIHIKDVDRAEESGQPIEVGRGAIDIPGFMEMLLKEKYNRVVSFEYEKDEDDPFAGLAESVGYVRGILKMLI